MIRLLGAGDFDQVAEMQVDENRKKVCGVQWDSIPYYHEAFRLTEFKPFTNYFLTQDNPNFRAYGYFDPDSGKLTSCFCIVLPETTNAWYLWKILSSATHKTKARMNGLVDLMSYVIDYAESKEVYQYWMAYPSHLFDAHANIWPKYVAKRRDNYISVITNIISAKTQPIYEDQWLWLMGQILWPVDLTVTLQIANAKSRTFNDPRT